MKKLFLLMAVFALCGSAMTSCSKDNEDNSWQSIPKKVEGDAVDFKVNGEKSTGTVEFNAKNNSQATITLNKVISGYTKVEMDVALVKQSDGSFNFTGEKGMTVLPVKATEAPALVNINVSGNVTLDGKAKVEIATSGAGLSVGTYEGETLVLTYSGAPVVSKKVILDAQSLTDVSIKFDGVFPGEKETILSGLKMNAGAISGSVKTAANTSVTCEGSIKDNVLTLNLKDIKINDPKGWAADYKLFTDYVSEDFLYRGDTMKNWTTSGALYVDWKYSGELNEDSNMVHDYCDIMAGLFRFAGSALLPQVLNTVKLQPDGNVCADIIAKPAITFDPQWAFGAFFGGAFPVQDTVKQYFPQSGWEVSPKNFAHWYEKDGRLYVKINIPAIIASQMGGPNPDLEALIAQILSGDAATVKGFIKELGFDLSGVQDETINMLLACVNDGFPFNVSAAAGHKYISLDKAFFDPLFTMREVDGMPTNDLLVVWNALTAAGLIPEDMALAGILFGVVGSEWSATTEFNLGLDFKN